MCDTTFTFHPVLEHSMQGQVFDLLVRCDGDFVPPLSKRTSTHQMTFSAGKPQNVTATSSPLSGPEEYFEELKMQRFILAVRNGELVGFLSYIDNCRLPYLQEPSAYVSTVCTHPAYRCQGIGGKLYAYLEETINPAVISLRTWSTNEAQMHLLRKRGYKVIQVVKDNRGPGIDSVYFAKKMR